MGFSRQEHWKGLPFPPPEDLLDPRIKPVSHVPCPSRHDLYHQRHLGSPKMAIFYIFPENTNWGNWRDEGGLELLFENQTISALSVPSLSKHWVTCLPFDSSEVKVLVGQSCPTLCDPMDCSPPGSSVHGILQARVLECVAISFSRGSSWPRGGTGVGCHFLLQGIFLTQGWNPGLLHYRQNLYHWATWEAPFWVKKSTKAEERRQRSLRSK